MRKVATIPSPTDDIMGVMTSLNYEGFLYAFGPQDWRARIVKNRAD